MTRRQVLLKKKAALIGVHEFIANTPSLNEPIDSLGLNTELASRLKSFGFSSVKDLCFCSDRRFLLYKGTPLRHLIEVQRAMESRGLKLGMCELD